MYCAGKQQARPRHLEIPKSVFEVSLKGRWETLGMLLGLESCESAQGVDQKWYVLYQAYLVACFFFFKQELGFFPVLCLGVWRLLC